MKKSRNVVRVGLVLATVLLFSSFAFIIVCGLLKDNGDGDFWWPAVGLIGFFTCDLLAIGLFVYFGTQQIGYEYDDKEKKYELQKFYELENIPKSIVKERFINNRFKQLDNGYLKKKVFSFLKDSITYFVDVTSSLSLRETLEYEFTNINKLEKKTKNNCAIFFIYKNDIDKNDFKLLRDISKTFILNEIVVPKKIVQTCIVILVDQNNNTGYFLDLDKKCCIAVYKHGCGLIKKYFR